MTTRCSVEMPSTMISSVSEARDHVYDYVFKLIVIGDCYVGKSAVASTCCSNNNQKSRWEVYVPTIGKCIYICSGGRNGSCIANLVTRTM